MWWIWIWVLPPVLFDGQASLVGLTQQESIDLDAVGPLLYGQVGSRFPANRTFRPCDCQLD